MDFGFSEDQETLRKSAREVLSERSTTAVVRAAMESDTGVDEGLWKTIAELGWCGVAVPDAEGGLGLGWVEQCILLEETGRAIVPAPYLTMIISLPAVLAAEPSPVRSELLQGIAAGETRVTVAFLEADGAIGGTLDARAEKSGTSWKLSGTKVFVPDAHVADVIIVVVATDDGPALFAVPASDLQVSQLKTIDKTRRLCEVRLDGATVGDDRRLVHPTPSASLRSNDFAITGIAAEETGIAQQALEVTVAYAKEREQFGKKIGTFQAVSHRLADMLLYAESARSNTYYAAWALDEGTPDAPLAAATARVSGIQAARFATAEGIQLHGGIGFTFEHDMHLYYRRAKWDELYLGDESLWRERIAELLAG